MPTPSDKPLTEPRPGEASPRDPGPRSISVLMPTFGGAEFLERVLAALSEQVVDVPWDFLAIDSGSTDGTVEILERWQRKFGVPFGIRHIHPVEFDHGDTRNLLAAESTGELLVFLTQDAIPTGPHWLARLHANFADPAVGAAYCRNLPRPDADLLTRVFSAGDPGYAPERREVRLPENYDQLDPHARRLLYNFNDVASAIRRDLWERHPFPRTDFGEDLLMARALLEAGFTVVYDERSTVEHSHDYGPDAMRARARIDGRFNAEYLDRICIASTEDAAAQVERQLELDRGALVAAGVEGDDLQRELGRARDLRRAAFMGLYEGGQSKRRFPKSRLGDGAPLHLLYVVHGFPPETWAGTEVYTLELAREMRRRGHRVTILARSPGPSIEAGGEQPKDYSIHRQDFEDLEVWRMINRLQFQRLSETYAQPGAEVAFRAFLAEVKPDLVHFQHLIHMSVGLVDVANSFGVPTVVHCHDYWPICARVQLIRPDGRRCEGNRGVGCYACIENAGLEHIDRLSVLDPEDERVPDRLRAAGVYNLHGLSDLMGRQAAVLAAWAAADLRISPSRFLREKLLETLRFDPHRFLYSDNGMRTTGLSPRAAAPAGQDGGPVRFGFVGSLVWYKGIELLVTAMERLGSRAVLNVHGAFDPDSDPLHRRLAERAGENVVFHGRFDNQRLAEVYAGIDVLVVPSVWFENSPITIHEAHLLETPVVTSDIGGMAEYVRDGVDGLHFKAGEVEDLAAVLGRFVEDRGLLERLSQSFPEIKSIDANGREMEFRYRALVALDRPSGEVRLLDRAANEHDDQRGGVEVQGSDYLLLRPGAAALYDLGSCGTGARRLTIELFALGAEPKLAMSGDVLVDGRKVGSFGPFSSVRGGGDATTRFSFDLELAAGAELEVRSHRGTCVRLSRVQIDSEVAALAGIRG